ncbi:MAG: SDR family oxidoreductase [Gammaproteobacteria bacterium]|nr:MAG: SDR family oxidoreductase [Gammaproteobacteria bacterium]
MLTRYAAAEYAKDGLRVNCIAPGGHKTYPVGVPKEIIEEAGSRLVPYIPMGRLGLPQEVKGLAVYLASDASGYVTGQTFTQDGGFTA